MTTGQILVSIGFVLAAAGTLFLSVDVLGFEKGVIDILNPMLHAEWLREQREDLAATAPSGDEAEMEIMGMKLGDIYKLMKEAIPEAEAKTREIPRKINSEVSETFEKHYRWIILSICLVFAGGAITVIGDLVFHP